MIDALYKFNCWAEKNITGYPLQGMCSKTVHYAINLDSKGCVQSFSPLATEKNVSPKMNVPFQEGRSCNIFPYFLCDDFKYVLGLEPTKDTDNSGLKLSVCERKFEASAKLHRQILSKVDNALSVAIKGFFEFWNPSEHVSDEKLIDIAKCNTGAGVINMIFRLDGKDALENKSIIECWQQYYEESVNQNLTLGICSVTGQTKYIARKHGQVSGISGASTAGASLVSFNEEAYCSYGKDQGYNAPISVQVSNGYVNALNFLVKSKENCFLLGGKTFLCWTLTSGKEVDILQSLLNDSSLNSSDVLSIMDNISKGLPVILDNKRMDLECEFHIMGLTPSKARLFVNLYYKNTFGVLLRNIQAHYERMQIDGCDYYVSPFRIMCDMLVGGSTIKGSDLVPGLLSSIIEDKRYPDEIFNKIMCRIRADHCVNKHEEPTSNEKRTNYCSRPAFIKAYLLKNSTNVNLKEVLTVELNSETVYMPYVLGRIFAVLERIQQVAGPGINTTIKDRYFDGACSTPSIVFPLLFQLSNKHLRKIERDGNMGMSVKLSHELDDLLTKVTNTLPASLTLEEQGVFIVGYYHQHNAFFKRNNLEER